MLAAACLAIGCALPSRAPRALKSPLEQLLLSQAIERSIAKATLELPEGTSVVLDSSGLSEDHRFVADAVEGWLGRQGLAIREEGDEAQYRLRMIVQSVGTDQVIDFFGMLPSSSRWIPVSLPEIALYKKVREEGFARFYFDIFEAANGRYVHSTSPVDGKAHISRYTWFIVFKSGKTDMTPPPEGFELIDDESL